MTASERIREARSNETRKNECKTCGDKPTDAICYDCGRGIPGWGETEVFPWPSK